MSKHDENPEWTAADFAKAQKPDAALPPAAMALFPKTRGLQKAPKKQQITLRLDPEVVEYYKSGGEGWQTRLNDDLRRAIPRIAR